MARQVILIKKIEYIIYLITNKINSKIYVGKSSFNDLNYYGSGILIRKAISKYGKENFTKTILEHCDNPAHLNEQEKYWIKYLQSYKRNIGYNRTMGGTGGALVGESLEKMKTSCKGRSISVESRQKISEATKGKRLGKNNPAYGKKPWNYGLTKDVDERIKKYGEKGSLVKKGRKLSEENKLNISKSLKGRNPYEKTDEIKSKISNTLTGRRLTEECKLNMSKAFKGRVQKVVICPHCGKTGGNTMYRWHFDKCKYK